MTRWWRWPLAVLDYIHRNRPFGFYFFCGLVMWIFIDDPHEVFSWSQLPLAIGFVWAVLWLFEGQTRDPRDR